MSTTDDAAGGGRRFVIRWTGATLVGWVIGIGVAVLLAQLCDAVGLESVQCVSGIGAGVGTGLLQGRVLASRLGGAGRWALATTLGMGVPFVAADAVTLVAGATPDLLVSVVAGALLAGWLQFRVLRRESASAWWWMPVSIAAWVVAAVAVLLGGYVGLRLPAGWLALSAILATWLAGGALFGLMTGAALARILRRD